MTSSYKSESRQFSFTVEKSYNKRVIDFNFGRHKDLRVYLIEVKMCIVSPSRELT